MTTQKCKGGCDNCIGAPVVCEDCEQAYNCEGLCACPTQIVPGDKLAIRAHTSKPGKGLTYQAFEAIAVEAGCTGGWDVIDVRPVGSDESAEPVSVYSFSVTIIKAATRA